MPGCNVCPLKDNPGVTGAGVLTGHSRFCQLLDSSHKDYNPSVLGSYLLTTEKLNDMTPGSLTTEKREIPSLPDRVASLFKAGARFIRSGLEVSSKEEMDRRISICHSCDEFKENTCMICGCRLTVKIASKAESCPIGKW